MAVFAIILLALLFPANAQAQTQGMDATQKAGYFWAQANAENSADCEGGAHSPAFIEGCLAFVTEWEQNFAQDITFSSGYRNAPPLDGEPPTHNFE